MYIQNENQKYFDRKLKSFLFVTPLIISTVSFIIPLFIVYIYNTFFISPYTASLGGALVSLGWFIIILVLLHNVFCGLTSYAMLLNLNDSVRKNVLLSFLLFTWYSLLLSIIFIFTRSSNNTLLYVASVLPAFLVQIFFFIRFRYKLSQR